MINCDSEPPQEIKLPEADSTQNSSSTVADSSVKTSVSNQQKFESTSALTTSVQNLQEPLSDNSECFKVLENKMVKLRNVPPTGVNNVELSVEDEVNSPIQKSLNNSNRSSLDDQISSENTDDRASSPSTTAGNQKRSKESLDDSNPQVGDTDGDQPVAKKPRLSPNQNASNADKNIQKQSGSELIEKPTSKEQSESHTVDDDSSTSPKNYAEKLDDGQDNDSNSISSDSDSTSPSDGQQFDEQKTLQMLKAKYPDRFSEIPADPNMCDEDQSDKSEDDESDSKSQDPDKADVITLTSGSDSSDDEDSQESSKNSLQGSNTKGNDFASRVLTIQRSANGRKNSHQNSVSSHDSSSSEKYTSNNVTKKSGLLKTNSHEKDDTKMSLTSSPIYSISSPKSSPRPSTSNRFDKHNISDSDDEAKKDGQSKEESGAEEDEEDDDDEEEEGSKIYSESSEEDQSDVSDVDNGGQYSEGERESEGWAASKERYNVQAPEQPIIVNDTKKLADLAELTSPLNTQSATNTKEPTVVIIDTETDKSNDSRMKMNNVPLQALYQSIAARGTTVTPVNKPPIAPNPPAATNLSSTPVMSNSTSLSTVILPSLTDDMFVVEAPSFIVPYVYEKPSAKPFRQFVDQLAAEIKIDPNEIQKEENALDLVNAMSIPTNNKRLPIKSRKKKDNDDDDWHGASTSDSDLSDDGHSKTVILKDTDDSLEKIKGLTDLTGEVKPDKIKTDSFFNKPLGNFLINIGMNLVQEHVQNDLLKMQKKKLYRESRCGGAGVKQTEAAISSLMKNIKHSESKNSAFKFPFQKCTLCSFRTECSLVLAHHLETPHMRGGVYRCNFCEFQVRSPHDILYHMESEHGTRGRLERAPAYHQCPNCPFEDNGRGKLARHQLTCAKRYKPDFNLAPPADWEPPAKIPKMLNRAKPVVNYQPKQLPPSNMSISNMSNAALMRGRGRPAAPPVTTPRPVLGAPLVRAGLIYRNTQLLIPANYHLLQSGQTTIRPNPPNVPQKSIQHQPSISITPLPRPAVPPTLSPFPPAGANKATFVICEICDGYIKDLEQLRNHMMWIHKVKIHPKMIYNRPPLNCQKCQFRFFTDQGLERHLLGSHGLVTSSMQEAANKGKDAGRCPACGRVYQWKLLNHVARDHNMTLKPAHLSYKCTVCTATFGMYKHFENHVYSAHSVVAKRVTEKTPSSSRCSITTTPSTTTITPATTITQSMGSESLLQPIKINNEITIIPQQRVLPTDANDKKDS